LKEAGMDTETERIVISEPYVEALITLFEDVRDKQLLIGDYLNILINTYDGRKSQVINYLSGRLNVSASTLYDYARISELWTPEHRQRYQSLDWTIYRNTNPNDPEDVELLNLCIDEGWSANKLKQAKYPMTEEGLYNRLVALLRQLSTSDYPKLVEIAERIKELI